jgi:hydroxymethylpyrimidine kinase/phosphomethylpyrimidine kinase
MRLRSNSLAMSNKRTVDQDNQPASLSSPDSMNSPNSLDPLDSLDSLDSRLPVVMTVGGFDPSAGAGVLADIKTIAAMRCYGVAVVTSITAQNTIAVYNAYHLTLHSVGHQMEALFDDFDVRAVKTGMLPSAQIVSEVARQLRNRSRLDIVVDPVLRASTGFDLSENSLQTIVSELFPLASLVTPNIHETEMIAGIRIKDSHSIAEAAQRIIELGAAAVLIKGGDLESEKATDVLLHRNGPVEIAGPRISSRNTHGTGCTLASAIACLLARGVDLELAVRTAKSYVAEAIRTAPGLGKGFGPLNHFPKFLS